jgi:hypothetical protein
MKFTSCRAIWKIVGGREIYDIRQRKENFTFETEIAETEKRVGLASLLDSSFEIPYAI